MREVIVWETVQESLSQSLEKESYERLRDRLIRELENKYQALRKERHPQDETIFIVTLYMFEGHRRRTFEFFVDDTMTDAHLFVLDVIQSVCDIA